MSTQHPDNVHSPIFSDNSVLNGEDEIDEAYYVFSTLNCQEQLFDYEGKEADNFIIKKLFTKYPDYFMGNILGKDKILSFRIPNPNIEKIEAKIVIEVLNTIPRYCDTAFKFYKASSKTSKINIPPISEVYVPMTSSALDIARVAKYYEKHVAGVQDISLLNNDINIGKWLGNFNPKSIRVTPLVEDLNSMLKVDQIAEEYIKIQKIKDHQRVWLARSDPALNYSSLSAILLNKLALVKLHKLQEKTSVDIFPIFGCGSSPFRGNFKPDTAEQIMRGYPSVQTYTLQSSFKYDQPLEKTKKAIEIINNTKQKKPHFLEEEKILKIIEKVSMEYKKQIRLLAEMINNISNFVPLRRKRKLHIGLFGYSRANDNIQLPRAIKFCCALYSIGLPPEILGLNALDSKDIDYLKSTCYANLDYDLENAMRYFNKDNLEFLPLKIKEGVNSALEKIGIMDLSGSSKLEINEEHKQLTTAIMKELKKSSIQDTESFTELITRAASIRGFIG
ncbi:phosphoenolpyruvate carboxylase [Candidatus Woesearchaeota archaeon]|nr:phosphoenolpyruvate carboxylase [Candidatus Woesearchaeota archaeon]